MLKNTYVLFIIKEVFILAIADTGFLTELLNPLISLWNSFVLLVPGLIAAIVLTVIGYVIAYILGHALKLVLVKTKLDQKVEQARISKAIGYIRLSSLFGELVKWYIFVIFLQSAVDVLELGTLSEILSKFVLWIPNLIAGLLVVIFGFLLAQFIKVKVQEHAKTSLAKTASNIFMCVIAAISVIIALGQIGIEIGILENLLIVVVASLGLGAALAIGLSFGLGNKKEANDLL